MLHLLPEILDQLKIIVYLAEAVLRLAAPLTLLSLEQYEHKSWNESFAHWHSTQVFKNKLQISARVTNSGIIFIFVRVFYVGMKTLKLFYIWRQKGWRIAFICWLWVGVNSVMRPWFQYKWRTHSLNIRKHRSARECWHEEAEKCWNALKDIPSCVGASYELLLPSLGIKMIILNRCYGKWIGGVNSKSFWSLQRLIVPHIVSSFFHFHCNAIIMTSPR